jgi:2'-5' RNA ligase
VRLTPQLATLQEHVTAATGLCGFVPETRPYHPHITLARSKKKGARGLRDLQNRIHRDPVFTHFVAETIALYESLVRPGGSHYEIRERFSLNG